MPVIKLNSDHNEQVFTNIVNSKFNIKSRIINDCNSKLYSDKFIQNFLTNLTNFSGYGFLDSSTNRILSIIGYHKNNYDSSWYLTDFTICGNGVMPFRHLIDSVTNINEQEGRFKFYLLIPTLDIKLVTKTLLGEKIKNEYDFFDEYYVPAKHKVKYMLAWHILYDTTLLPIDTIVRCYFKKNTHRGNLYNAGRL